LGAFVSERSDAKLWSALSDGPLAIAFTVPTSRQFEALATALKKQISSIGVEKCLTFIQGSISRTLSSISSTLSI